MRFLDRIIQVFVDSASPQLVGLLTKNNPILFLAELLELCINFIPFCQVHIKKDK